MMLVVVTIANTVFAATTSIIDTTKKGSVTITASEQKDGNGVLTLTFVPAQFVDYKTIVITYDTKVYLGALKIIKAEKGNTIKNYLEQNLN